MNYFDFYFHFTYLLLYFYFLSYMLQVSVLGQQVIFPKKGREWSQNETWQLFTESSWKMLFFYLKQLAANFWISFAFSI